MANALTKLVEELSFPTKEPISLKVQNRHLLEPIEIKLIKSRVLEEEVITLGKIL